MAAKKKKQQATDWRAAESRRLINDQADIINKTMVGMREAYKAAADGRFHDICPILDKYYPGQAGQLKRDLEE